MNNILEIIMLFLIIGVCIISIRSELKRNKQMDEVFKRMQSIWKDND